MTANAITPIVMPKWGLSMREGTVVSWLVDEGTAITVGMPILEVETDKIANAVEAADAGLLRRRIASAGEVLPVKALLGVMAPGEVSDAEIDAYVAAYVVPAAEEAEAGEAEAAYQWTEVDGIRIRCARRGEQAAGKTPVVFLHGFGGDLDNWLFNLDAVATAAPVIALDLPGHGQSDVKLPGGGSLADLAGFVLHALDALGVSKAHFVGHSMGGAIAAKLALAAPGRVASLVLLAPAGLGAEINRAYLDGFIGAATRRELKPVVEQLFADPALVSRRLLDDLLRYKRLDGVGDLLARLAAALFPDGRQAEQPVAQLAGVPLMIVWGRDDRVIPAAQASAAPAGAEVRLLDGAGHMTMMEKAGEVNAAILARVQAGG